MKSREETSSVPIADPVLSDNAPLLVLSSDSGFTSEIKEFAEVEGFSVFGVPPAGFGPREVRRKYSAAVVDCRSYFGVAQKVMRNLHEIHPGLPILAVVSNSEREKSKKDLLYGAGADFCISEEARSVALEESVHLLMRLTRTKHRLENSEEILRIRSMELSALRRDMDESQLQLAKRVQEQITVYRAARAMMRVFDFDDLANEIVRLGTIELGAEVGSLMLIDGNDLVVRALYGHIPGEDPILGRRQNVGEGISGWVAREGKPLLIRDIDRHDQFRERGGVRYKTKSCVSCPIIARGRIRGVININNKKGGDFSEDDLRLLQTLAMTSGFALDNFELIEQIRRAETLSNIGELATRMAHEIRNPLHAIKMNIQILGKKFPMDEDDREYYDILLGEIERLENLVREVLSFARQDRLNLVSCDLNRLLDRTLAVLKSLLDEKDIELVFDPAPDLPMILADEAKIEQAVMNLVVNAVEAVSNGGTLRISTEVFKPFIYPRSQYGEEIPDAPQDEHRHAVVTVRDNGTGIKREYFSKIFRPFFTTKVDGTGLGLSTTRKIIESHGGNLTFESKVEVGTTFKIELPVAEDSPKNGTGILENIEAGR